MAEPKRILIVENDIDALSVIYTTLLPLDYQVEAAMEGSELKPRIDRFQPDLLLLGFNVSDRDEAELCDWIKQHYNARIIGIGRREELQSSWVGSLCLDDMLHKPIEPMQLLSKINSQLPV